MQVDPIKRMLKAPGTSRLRLYHDEPPSRFALEFNLRRYIKDLVGAEIDEWGKKNQGNIRTMLAHLGDVLWAGAYTRPLVSSNRAVSGTKYTIGTPTMTPDTC